jgi:hypothetical protein
MEEARKKLMQADAEHKFHKWREEETKKNLFSSFLDKVTTKLDDGKGKEIGVPINIKHEGHIGFDSKDGFTVNNFLVATEIDSDSKFASSISKIV